MSGDQEMMDLFVQESGEHIQALEANLILLEGNPTDSDLLNSVFRSVHSIKGAAGFFGFEPIVKLAHVMESVMSLLRDGEIHANGDMMTLLISTSDKLRFMLAEPEAAGKILCDDETTGLQAILDNRSGTKSAPAPASPSEPAPEAACGYPHPALDGFSFSAETLVEGLKHGRNFYSIRLDLEEHAKIHGQEAEEFFRELRSIGEILDTVLEVPSEASLAKVADFSPVARVFFQSALEPFILGGALGIDGSQITEVPSAVLKDWAKSNPQGACRPAATSSEIVAVQKSPVPRPASAPAVAEKPGVTNIDPKPVPSQRRKAEETIRINVGLLDILMNLAGEMVLGRNKLLRLAGVGTSHGDRDELHSIVQEISSVTSSLQDTVMRARLQPMGGLFGKFNRIVRDLGQKLNKDIQLEVFGDDVELDRTLIEGLSDPLTHLVRNSIDHGIEKAGDRLAAGKPAHGTVRLSAAHLAGRVQIEVSDDGAGIDPERLKAKAVEKGMLSADQASRLADNEALNLIFAAGFSTAAAVSDISGRGVGMDVVKTNIEKLGGHVDLDSRVGQGTRITIRLPLTLAIVPALIVGCRGSGYALPQINVEEIVRPGAECPIKTIGGARVLELRGELIPVVSLAEILGAPSGGRDEFVVLLQLEHSIFGLVVDEIRSNEEIVVKPLGRHLRTATCYSGATLLGQGEIALILDPPSIAQGRIPSTQKALGSTKALEVSSVSTSSRVLVFQAGGSEPLAVRLGQVQRVESVSAADIEKIGNIDCLRKNHDSTIRLVRFSDVIPVGAPDSEPREFFIIVPRPPFGHIGFIATKILDSVELPDSQIEQGTLASPGVFGSAVLFDRLTLVLDLPAILDGLSSAGQSPQSLVAEGRFLLTANPSQNLNHPIKQLPAQAETTHTI